MHLVAKKDMGFDHLSRAASCDNSRHGVQEEADGLIVDDGEQPSAAELNAARQASRQHMATHNDMTFEDIDRFVKVGSVHMSFRCSTCLNFVAFG